MTELTMTCPSCGYTKQVDATKIPVGATNATCPQCNKTFQLEAEVKNVLLQPQSNSPAQPAQQHLPFSFTGNAREYFGIWIVNTLLKIVTLGIYSPWAKVRKRRYFYGNTRLDDANFDYLANPIALLKGWLIGAALFVAYSVGAQYSPIIGMVFGVLFFLLVPWVIVRSKLFNNRNTAHRNIRFNFKPDYAEAYKVYVLLPIGTVLTLGLLAPYVYYRQKRFLMLNNRFGRSAFGFDAGVKDFYKIALLAFGAPFIVGLIAAIVIPQISVFLPSDGTLPAIIGMALPLLMVCGYFLVGVYSYVRIANLTWNGTHLGKSRFVSTMRVRDMAWIMFSNAVASVLSVGLLVPWASIRLARYRLENLAVNAEGNLNDYRNGSFAETSAAGEEIGDIFGVDIGV